tara:strand:+ start:780 stop:1463 length:684 start_codon:yes stop_codon:yes gene_type:complete
MINIGIVTDTTWDNYIQIFNKLKKINSEYYRLHAIYGKTLELINICSNKNYLTLIRHYSDNLSKTIYNMLKICDLWIIFTNYIEYNTSTRLVIEKCDEYNIKYLIISEYDREFLYSSFKYDHTLSFKKNLNQITKKNDINITEFNLDVYNLLYLNKYHINIQLPPDIRNKLKDSYDSIYKKKQDKSIKLLYDKDEIKKEKQFKKTHKQAKQLEYSNNKIKYYKQINN